MRIDDAAVERKTGADGQRTATTDGRFRHDPVKNTIDLAAASAVRWDVEPVVCAHRRMTYANQASGRDMAVPISATPAAVSGIGVVCASDDGYVRMLDRSLSKAYWERRLNSSIYASIVTDRRRRRVVVAATSGLVAAIDLRGRVAWTTDVGRQIYATPAVVVDADLVVLACFDSEAIALHLGSGNEAFRSSVAEPWSAPYGGLAAYRDPYASPVVTGTGHVVVAHAEHLSCFEPDGDLRWSTRIGASVKSSPAAIDDTGEVVVCSVDGRCTFVRTTTGEVTATIELGSKLISSPAVSGGVVAIGTSDDEAVGVDVAEHAVVWRRPRAAPRDYTSFTTLPSGDFIANGARGNVICVRARDGAFLWESSQVLGLVDHEPPMDITPVAAADGMLYCGSYNGDLYAFRFPLVDGQPDG